MQKRKLPGFTLIELLITAVLSALLLMTVSAMFMTFMVGNARTNIRRQLSTEGNRIIQDLEFNIRNATTIGVGTTADSAARGTCTGVPGNYMFISRPGPSSTTATYAYRYLSTPRQLRVFHTDTGEVALNSTFADMTELSMQCVQDTNTQKKEITITFYLSAASDENFYNTNSTLAMPFSAKVSIRN